MQNILLAVIAILALTNTAAIYYIKVWRSKYVDEENARIFCGENVRELEKQIFEAEIEKNRLKHLNIELAKTNRTLKARLEKINNQVKQISDHFKTN